MTDCCIYILGPQNMKVTLMIFRLSLDKIIHPLKPRI